MAPARRNARLARRLRGSGLVLPNLSQSGAIPALEAMLRFSGERHTLIVNNLANISTPGYIQQDVSVERFQDTLRAAIRQRRAQPHMTRAGLDLSDDSELSFDPAGRLTLNPETTGGGVLFHDRNNRDLESQMQDLVENATTYRVASDLLRARYQSLQNAIAERVA